MRSKRVFAIRYKRPLNYHTSIKQPKNNNPKKKSQELEMQLRLATQSHRQYIKHIQLLLFTSQLWFLVQNQGTNTGICSLLCQSRLSEVSASDLDHLEPKPHSPYLRMFLSGHSIVVLVGLFCFLSRETHLGILKQGN